MKKLLKKKRIRKEKPLDFYKINQEVKQGKQKTLLKTNGNRI